MDPKVATLRAAYDAAQREVEKQSRAWDALPADAKLATVSAAQDALNAAVDAADAARERYEKAQRPVAAIRVDEPDMYVAGGQHSFFVDLYASQLRSDPMATERISKHQAFEVERYAVSTGTLGGAIPPQYLVDMYAKASRNGRVFADQVSRQPLPDVGVSLIVPRFTAGTSAAVQAAEGNAVSTADPTEADLTVPVRTIAGYSPVSRQTLERAAYSEQILFEDLVARYFAALDVDILNGSGSSGHMLGLNQTSGISTSSTSTATIAGVWGKIADVIQQINTQVGGLGYKADKIFMTPARWGWFTAALDTQNRPLFGIYSQPAVTVIGVGQEAGYGPVGMMHGLPVFTDANIPANLGGGTNQDIILVIASPVVHLWEQNDDGMPVTVAFEQQAGTSLQVQLVAYGYAAFTAGRYPAASGVVSGTGLITPTF